MQETDKGCRGVTKEGKKARGPVGGGFGFGGCGVTWSCRSRWPLGGSSPSSRPMHNRRAREEGRKCQ